MFFKCFFIKVKNMFFMFFIRKSMFLSSMVTSDEIGPNDAIVEKVINIDPNSRSQTALFSFKIIV